MKLGLLLMVNGQPQFYTAVTKTLTPRMEVFLAGSLIHGMELYGDQFSFGFSAFSSTVRHRNMLELKQEHFSSCSMLLSTLLERQV
jgi:hypothetical protein